MKYLLLIIITGCLVLLGCEPDEAEDIDRDRLTGSWLGEDKAVKSAQSIYSVLIESSTKDSITIFIDNFHNLGSNNFVEAKLFGTYIEINGFVTGDQYVIDGTGEPNSNYTEINWEYTVDILDGNPIDYTAVYIKQ